MNPSPRVSTALDHRAYEWLMAALAVISVAVLAIDAPWVVPVNLAVYVIFVGDYVVRLVTAEDRGAFVRRNLLDLIAIIPADFFRLARVARLARFARAGSLFWRTSGTARALLAENGLGTVLLVSGGIVLSGATAAWLIDPVFATFGDALWWAVVTSTTVGYGDLAPSTTTSRAVATVIMFVGIGTVGMLTASIATYFSGRRSAVSNEALGGASVHLTDGRILHLTDEQTGHLMVMLRGADVAGI
jgi:voltage-gated potassium channel